MKFSEAIAEIARAYIPGTAAHFGAMEKNPWQKAHDDFEKVMQLGDGSLEELATERFVRDCKRLIEEFRKTGKPAPEITPADAFHLGDPKQHAAWRSVHYKRCIHCETKQNLELMPWNSETLNVVLICRACKEGAA